MRPGGGGGLRLFFVLFEQGKQANLTPLAILFLITDVMNSLYAGCITGATFGAKSGPQAMCLGCGGMAAFTLVIDRIMGH